MVIEDTDDSTGGIGSHYANNDCEPRPVVGGVIFNLRRLHDRNRYR